MWKPVSCCCLLVKTLRDEGHVVRNGAYGRVGTRMSGRR